MKTTAHLVLFSLFLIAWLPLHTVSQNDQDNRDRYRQMLITAKSDMEKQFSNIRFMATAEISNHFHSSEYLRKKTRGYPLLSQYVITTETHYNHQYLKLDGHEISVYSKSNALSDIEQLNHIHTQTGQWTEFITPTAAAILADPNAINKKHYPQWTVKPRSAVSPL